MTGITTTPMRGGGNSWQLIIADLALILFLLTLSALPIVESQNGARQADREARENDARARPAPQIDASQALFRPVPGGPGLGEWLAGQAPDPRATLTIFAIHTPGKEAAAWSRAEALAAEARERGAQVRTIIHAGTADETYASLAYDAAVSAPD